MGKKIRIGSRDSQLAIAQAKLVIEEIKKYDSDRDVELITMKTTGDMFLDRRLDQIGGKGLFVKELDRALVEGQIDLSVHSLKDLPAEISEEIPLVGFLKREDPRDCLLYKEKFRTDRAKSFEKQEMVIGSSSRRRILQLKKIYPHAKFEMIRGNVQTRIRKLEEQEFSAVCLAFAGLKRLDMEERADRIFSVEEIIPAAGQGIIAIQGRQKEEYGFLKKISDKDAHLAAAAERAFIKAVDGGCSAPMACYAEIGLDNLTISGLYWEEKTNISRTGKETILFNSGETEKEAEKRAVEAGWKLARRLKGEEENGENR